MQEDEDVRRVKVSAAEVTGGGVMEQNDKLQDACLNDDFVCLLPRKVWFLGGVRSSGVMCCGGGGNIHTTHVPVSDLRLEP